MKLTIMVGSRKIYRAKFDIRMPACGGRCAVLCHASSPGAAGTIQLMFNEKVRVKLVFCDVVDTRIRVEMMRF